MPGMVQSFLLTTFILLTLGVAPVNAENAPCAQSATALSLASKYSGLSIKHPVECRALNPQEYENLSREIIKHDISIAHLPAEESALKDIGFIPDTYPYAECLIQNVIGSAAAFYDARHGYFALPAWSDSPLAILVHEATHALQDQHYHLLALNDLSFYFSDRNFAYASLIEGHAMFIEGRYSDDHPGENTDPDESQAIAPSNPACKLPDLLSTLLSAPYVFGKAYVETLNKKSGQTGILSAFKAPPQSSQEILTGISTPPSKRLARDSNVLSKKYGHAVFSSEIGLLGIIEYFGARLPQRYSAPLRGAWRGDLLSHYGTPGKEITVWSSEWGDSAGARKFYEGLLAFWGRARKGSFDGRASELLFILGSRTYYIKHDGTMVHLLVGNSTEQLAHTAALL